MTRYTSKKRSARKKAIATRPTISPSLKGWIVKWSRELEKLHKKKRPSKKDLQRLKVLQQRLKEARALIRKPKAALKSKKGSRVSKKAKKTKKAQKAKKRPQPTKKLRKVKKRPPESKKPAPKKPAPKKPAPKKPAPKKPAPKKPAPKKPAPKKPAPKKPAPKKPAPKKPRPKKRPKLKGSILEPEGPKEEPKPIPRAPGPPQAPEAIVEELGVPQGLEITEGVPEGPETVEEAKKRFEEALREYERTRQKEKARREKADKELREQLAKLEEERARILGVPAVEPPSLLPPLEERLEERFDELLEIAERTGQIPVPTEGPINSEGSFGDSVSVLLKDYLTEETLEEMIYRIEEAAMTLQSKYPIWISFFTFSAAGKELVGYGIKTLLADDDDALKFQVQGFDTTGIFSNRPQMILAIRNTLEGLLDKEDVTIYMHFAVIQNYERKSDAEQKKWRKDRRARYLEEKRLASSQGKK